MVAWIFRLSSDLKAEQAVHLDDKRAVEELGRPGRRQRIHVLIVCVDDEQLAAGRIFPPHPQVGAERAVGRVVLDKRARIHARREHVGRARPIQREDAGNKAVPGGFCHQNQQDKAGKDPDGRIRADRAQKDRGIDHHGLGV